MVRPQPVTASRGHAGPAVAGYQPFSLLPAGSRHHTPCSLVLPPSCAPGAAGQSPPRSVLHLPPPHGHRTDTVPAPSPCPCTAPAGRPAAAAAFLPLAWAWPCLLASVSVMQLLWLPTLARTILEDPLLAPGMEQLRLTVCTLWALGIDGSVGADSPLCRALTPFALGSAASLTVGGVLPLCLVHIMFERHVLRAARDMGSGRWEGLNGYISFVKLLLWHVPLMLLMAGATVVAVAAVGLLRA